MPEVVIEMMAFELSGHALGLDFVNTLDGRLETAPLDRLDTYEHLLLFGVVTGSLTEGEAKTLAGTARRYPGTAADVLDWARELREALFRLLQAGLDGQSIDEEDLAVLNEALSHAGGHERLEHLEGRFVPHWATTDDGSIALDRPLWPVTRSAALLLTGQMAGTLRACAAADCAVLFLDTTRNGSRRWCSRNGCGNRERVRQFRERRRVGDGRG